MSILDNLDYAVYIGRVSITTSCSQVQGLQENVMPGLILLFYVCWQVIQAQVTQ